MKIKITKKSPILDLSLKINKNSILYKLYDKRDKFGFPIVNFPNLTGNIPTGQSYGVFISQLVRYSRCCQNFVNFKERTSIFSRKINKTRFQICQTLSYF